MKRIRKTTSNYDYTKHDVKPLKSITPQQLSLPNDIRMLSAIASLFAHYHSLTNQRFRDMSVSFSLQEMRLITSLSTCARTLFSGSFKNQHA